MHAKWRCNKTIILIDEDRLRSLNGWARKDPFFRIAMSRTAVSGGRDSCRIVREEEDRRKFGSLRGLAVSQAVREPTLGRRIASRKMNCVSYVPRRNV
jgi:hypothetical protein